ncbi:hypothetical protein M8C21_011258 [Ambrosia artemisiifolia]|uniref:Uncharacterized protein n=1 Tax=Ambrosia artemisiifolia TaxID=4212 RepID=A0AAD5D521_AMBAR|nr:hypothetical protein M8C21_011258 [Ambrosia artemisiifolia]
MVFFYMTRAEDDFHLQVVNKYEVKKGKFAGGDGGEDASLHVGEDCHGGDGDCSDCVIVGSGAAFLLSLEHRRSSPAPPDHHRFDNRGTQINDFVADDIVVRELAGHKGALPKMVHSGMRAPILWAVFWFGGGRLDAELKLDD